MYRPVALINCIIPFYFMHLVNCTTFEITKMEKKSIQGSGMTSIETIPSPHIYHCAAKCNEHASSGSDAAASVCNAISYNELSSICELGSASIDSFCGGAGSNAAEGGDALKEVFVMADPLPPPSPDGKLFLYKYC